MANHFLFVFFIIVLTVINGISAADDSGKSQPPSPSKTVADNKAKADNSTKNLINSLGPSQDYADYEIPLELAPDGVTVVGDYVPASNDGGRGVTDTLAQPEEEKTTPPPSSASRSSSTVLAVVVAVGGAILFFF
ncbi:hypothetical protein CARUB_v10019074mg [Capsella rubella]|uniref:Transmembrane protein n=1 Tax=Capsella rubella TaxID=81985 RepID=R0HKH3_9BRAS|nr:uncharacterized protein LOC17886518 [Capsella rubella]EOA25720.1 hypothetical protein CARUB_v10019074mg [Capsella rubella]